MPKQNFYDSYKATCRCKHKVRMVKTKTKINNKVRRVEVGTCTKCGEKQTRHYGKIVDVFPKEKKAELDVCPFCGTPRPVMENVDPDWKRVACSHRNCWAVGPVRKTTKGAMGSWNRRHAISRHVVKAKELKERESGVITKRGCARRK